MRVLLVNPPRFKGIPVIREDRCENADRDTLQPPVSYIYMAGILREQGHRVDFLDCNSYDYTFQDVRTKIVEFTPDTVLFRSTPSTFFHDCTVAKIARAADVRTVMLNWNLAAFSKEAMELVPELDVYVTAYSYELLLPRLFEGEDLYNIPGITFREEKMIVENPELRIEKVGDIPPPAWDLVKDHSVYFTRARAISPWGVIRGSKGCGFTCTMCIDEKIPWDPRSPELVVDEVEQLVKEYGVKYLTFFDNTFTINRKWAEEVCYGMLDREVKCKWFINTRPEYRCLDEEWLLLGKKAGLDGVSLGLEAGADRSLETIKKGFTVKEGVEVSKLVKKVGLKVYLSLILGYPGETVEEMKATRDLVTDIKPHGFQFSIMTPYPRTTLYKTLLEEGKLERSLNWDVMSCVPTGLPETVSICELTGEELVKLRQKFYQYLYLHPSYILPNLWWTLTHPSDFRIGLSYVRTLLDRAHHKVTYAH